MLDFLLCECISLGFRGGAWDRRARARKGRGANFFNPASIQILSNAPLGTVCAVRAGHGGCDPHCCFPAASLEEGFLHSAVYYLCSLTFWGAQGPSTALT